MGKHCKPNQSDEQEPTIQVMSKTSTVLSEFSYSNCVTPSRGSGYPPPEGLVAARKHSDNLMSLVLYSQY